MISRSCCRAFQCVAIDLNTQRDFCQPDGAFPVENLDALIPELRRVIAWIKRNQTPVVSSIEAHREFELSDSGNPIHCVDGSGGQEKLDFTLLANRTYVRSDNTLGVPMDLFASYQQVIFWKRTDDLLSNPKADRLVSQLPAAEFLIFGVGIESCIKAITLALLARNKSVTIVSGACGYWSHGTADQAMRQMTAKGARFVTVDQLLNRKLDRTFRYGAIPGHVRLQYNPNNAMMAIQTAQHLSRTRPPTRLPLHGKSPKIVSLDSMSSPESKCPGDQGS